VNGQKHGVQEKWYGDGQQEYKWNFVNGQKHGVQEKWYYNGRQEYKENYVNGQYHGVQEGWRRNGQPDYKKYYLDGTEVSQETYQKYIQEVAPTVQETVDFEERGLSGIIAGYLKPDE
jgi:antitoxin component YwqK of YwqJK toxin-antitoxin module